MRRRKFTVQVRAEHLDKLPEIASALRQAGLTIQDQIAELGHFSGVADESAKAKLEAVNGVKTVNEAGNEGDPDPADYRIS